MVIREEMPHAVVLEEHEKLSSGLTYFNLYGRALITRGRNTVYIHKDYRNDSDMDWEMAVYVSNTNYPNITHCASGNVLEASQKFKLILGQVDYWIGNSLSF